MHIEVTTPDCKEGEAYCFDVPEDTPMSEISIGLGVFYPDWTAIYISKE